jgi:hypothetical protein
MQAAGNGGSIAGCCRAQEYADQAEADASFAVDYAYAAIDEAEYAVLDAALARKEADEMAAAPG